MTDKSEALQAEIQRIRERIARRHQQNRADDERRRAIEAELHAISIRKLVAVPGGVISRSRYPAGHKASILNGLTGTALDVRRTKATVDFGEAGRWTIPIAHLLPASKQHLQGELICL
jgi:hypothetical protein